MYKVCDRAGNMLAKFAGIGRARDFARMNKPCQLRNKHGKVIATF
jgi:hypothetical protein